MTARTAVAVFGLAVGFLVADSADVWARAGGGGSRGSRSYSSPARPAPVGPTAPSTPSRSLNQPAAPTAPQRPGFFGGGFMGGLAGFALGGLIGSMLFGGLGHGLGGFGGIGLLEMVLIGGAAYFLFRFLRNRQAQQPQPAYAGAGGATSAYTGGGDRSWGTGSGAPTVEMPTAPSDLERGIANIRTMDPGLDLGALADHARRVYFVVQQAIGMRELAGVREYLAPEMATVLQEQCDRLRAARQTNRVEQLDVRRAEVSEAWQESGRDYVTIFISASMLDYTVDDTTGAVVEGSRTVPQTVEDFWTFTRPVGANPWRLSAIQTA